MSKARDDQRTYENGSQQQLMAVVEYLAQDVIDPKGRKEISEALNLSNDQVFRTLWNLQDRGWVEEVALGVRLSPRFVQISDRLRLAVADVLKRYLINPEGNSDG